MYYHHLHYEISNCNKHACIQQFWQESILILSLLPQAKLCLFIVFVDFCFYFSQITSKLKAPMHFSEYFKFVGDFIYLYVLSWSQKKLVKICREIFASVGLFDKCNLCVLNVKNKYLWFRVRINTQRPKNILKRFTGSGSMNVKNVMDIPIK